MKDALKTLILKKNQQMTTKVLKSSSVQRVISIRLIESSYVSTEYLLNKPMPDSNGYIHVYTISRKKTTLYRPSICPCRIRV